MTELSLSEFNNLPQPAPKQHNSLDPRIGILVAAAVVIAGVSFFAGMQYQKGKAPATVASTVTSQSGASGPGGFSGGFQRGNRAFGTVTSVSNTSITVQTRSGTSSTYTLTSSTTVMDNGQTSSVSSIQSGDTVVLTLDSSNTQDVTSIMLNPSFGGGFGGSAGGGSGSSSSSDSSGADSSGATNVTGA